MSRLVAFYELLEEDSRVLVELPVVGLSDVLDGTPRRGWLSALNDRLHGALDDGLQAWGSLADEEDEDD